MQALLLVSCDADSVPKPRGTLWSMALASDSFLRKRRMGDLCQALVENKSYPELPVCDGRLGLHNPLWSFPRPW